MIENREEREEERPYANGEKRGERTREKGRKIEKNVVLGFVLEEKPFKSLARS